jgi:nucleoside-diphosphate-sugar epimerase
MNSSDSPPVAGFLPLPEAIRTEVELDELLVRPRPELVEAIRTVRSPLVVLGAGGKMGPSLAVLARRAAMAAGHPLEVLAVSRFGSTVARDWLEARGVRTLAADLLDRREVERLPEASDAVYLVGRKFGTTQNPAGTWAVNTLVPAWVCERYAAPGNRMVVVSTANVYPMVPVEGRGARETDALTPLGEYANAAVARERVFDWYSRERGLAVALMRLSYAVDLRYGVLVDIAARVRDGEVVELGNSRVNCIWQGDANESVLRAFPLAGMPAAAWNLCRPEALRVRWVAEEFGRRFGRTPRFGGEEGSTALLSDTGKLTSVLGEPAVGVERLIDWVAAWMDAGGRLLGKPTHFEARDGRF